MCFCAALGKFAVGVCGDLQLRLGQPAVPSYIFALDQRDCGPPKQCLLFPCSKSQVKHWSKKTVVGGGGGSGRFRIDIRRRSLQIALPSNGPLRSLLRMDP